MSEKLVQVLAALRGRVAHASADNARNWILRYERRQGVSRPVAAWLAHTRERFTALVCRGPDLGLRKWMRTPRDFEYDKTPLQDTTVTFLQGQGAIAQRVLIPVRLGEGAETSVPALLVRPVLGSSRVGVIGFNLHASAALSTTSEAVMQLATDASALAIDCASAGVASLLVTSYDWGATQSLHPNHVYLRDLIGGSSLAPLVATAFGAVNSLTSAVPQIDRIVATGLSDGGFQAGLLAALDDRVVATHILPGPGTSRAAAAYGAGWASEFATHAIWREGDAMDWWRLLADRHTLITWMNDDPATAALYRDEVFCELFALAPLAGGSVATGVYDSGHFFGPEARAQFLNLITMVRRDAGERSDGVSVASAAIPISITSDLYDRPRGGAPLGSFIKSEIEMAARDHDPSEGVWTLQWEQRLRECLRAALAVPAVRVVGEHVDGEVSEEGSGRTYRFGRLGMVSEDGDYELVPFVHLTDGKALTSLIVIDPPHSGSHAVIENVDDFASLASGISDAAGIFDTDLLVVFPSGFGVARHESPTDGEACYTIPAALAAAGRSPLGLGIAQYQAAIAHFASRGISAARVGGFGPRSSALSLVWAAMRDPDKQRSLLVLARPLTSLVDLAREDPDFSTGFVVDCWIPELAFSRLLSVADLCHLLALARHGPGPIELRNCDLRMRENVARVQSWLLAGGDSRTLANLPPDQETERKGFWRT